MSKVDYKKMVVDVNKIVNNDWGFDIDSLSLHPNRLIPQETAWEMQKALMNIYQITHQSSCNAHGSKYRIATQPKFKKAGKE